MDADEFGAEEVFEGFADLGGDALDEGVERGEGFGVGLVVGVFGDLDGLDDFAAVAGFGEEGGLGGGVGPARLTLGGDLGIAIAITVSGRGLEGRDGFRRVRLGGGEIGRRQSNASGGSRRARRSRRGTARRERRGTGGARRRGEA